MQIASEQLLFERVAEGWDGQPGERVLVAVNASGQPASVQAGELNGSFRDLLADGASAASAVALNGALELAPYETRYLLAC